MPNGSWFCKILQNSFYQNGQFGNNSYLDTRCFNAEVKIACFNGSRWEGETGIDGKNDGTTLRRRSCFRISLSHISSLVLLGWLQYCSLVNQHQHQHIVALLVQRVLVKVLLMTHLMSRNHRVTARYHGSQNQLVQLCFTNSPIAEYYSH